MEHYDIFISYRRNGGFETAKHLYDLLTRDGYKVSFDIDTLRAGDFDKQLYNRIDKCKDFIIIIDKNAFDRTINHDDKYKPEQDWLRCELSYALKKNKNIIPIFLAEVDGFPENLPTDIKGIIHKNGPEYNKYHFNAFYEDLKKRFLLSLPKTKWLKYLLYTIASICVIVGIILLIANNTSENNPFVDDTTIINSINNDVNVNTNSPKENEPDNQRHMEYDGAVMNKDVDSFASELMVQGYSIVEKQLDAYMLKNSTNQIIHVIFDKQNNNKVLGVTEETEYTTDQIGDIIMDGVEGRFANMYNDFNCEEDYGYISFDYGKIVVGENTSKKGYLLIQYIDSVNTQGYKLWNY